MPVTHSYIRQLLSAIAIEEKEELKRYSLDQQHTLKSLKAEGLALHPIVVTKKNFGYADYPEVSFRLPFPAETNHFRDGMAIEFFTEGEEAIKGILINLDGKTGEFRLFAPDFPDWLEDKQAGIKLAPDQRTTAIMKAVLNNLEGNNLLFKLFSEIHPAMSGSNGTPVNEINVAFINKNLNVSQENAVKAIVQNEKMTIVHGPPGTGKTTTLAEGIEQLVRAGEKVLVSAPSNTAVDNIAKTLSRRGLRILRFGNATKADAEVFSNTPEGKLFNSKQQKDVKELKKRAEDFRRMALKYKRSFGTSEREQRNLLFKEVKNIRTEIRRLQAYNEEKLFSEAQVILGTPIGLYDAQINKIKFETLVIDEAGQCIEPLAWCIFPLAVKYVLAGDHLQLPPTVLSTEAGKMGLNKSILEVCIEAVSNIFLLNVQYRMRESIAGFSNEYFYKGQLKTASHLADKGIHVTFIDTAGTGYNETSGSGGSSLQNEGELQLTQKLIESNAFDSGLVAFVSPYSGQVAAAKDLLPANMRVSTIDSFQGQEKEIIILSLVRSNDEGNIGFLKDYRRMNVAMTRAKEQLFVIGDSATIGTDHFYNSFLAYVELHGKYKSAWEFENLI